MERRDERWIRTEAGLDDFNKMMDKKAAVVDHAIEESIREFKNSDQRLEQRNLSDGKHFKYTVGEANTQQVDHGKPVIEPLGSIPDPADPSKILWIYTDQDAYLLDKGLYCTNPRCGERQSRLYSENCLSTKGFKICGQPRDRQPA